MAGEVVVRHGVGVGACLKCVRAHQGLALDRRVLSSTKRVYKL
jgi:hypothetical protein